MSLRYQVKRFKSASIALKELEPFVRNGFHLQSGKPFAKLGGMRSREAWANWLACAAINAWAGSDRLTFTSDPIGGDGIIFDQATGETWPTEHVMVTRRDAGRSVESLILERVRQKRNKGGAAYAQGKTLMVLLDVIGEPWFPTEVAKALPRPLWFEAVWVIGLDNAENGYVYNVTRLDTRMGQAPVWRVHVAPGFDAWDVAPIQ